MSDFKANWVMSELSGFFGSNNVDKFCIINALDSVVVTGKEGIGMRARLAACL